MPGAVSLAVGGGHAMLVSPVIDNDFALPPFPGALPNGGPNWRWPAFPVALAGAGGSTAALPASAKNNITMAALFLNEAITYNCDVQVTITCPQFAAGDSIRVYNRVFYDDGTETRGSGVGAIIGAGGSAILRLRDPLGLVDAQNIVAPIAPNPSLMPDVVVGPYVTTIENFRKADCIDITLGRTRLAWIGGQ